MSLEFKARAYGKGAVLDTGMEITLAQRAVPSDEVLFQEVGGEAVILDLASESYFGLDQVGTRIWNLLLIDPGLQSVYESLQTEFEVDPAQLECDLLALVRKLADSGLVRIA